MEVDTIDLQTKIVQQIEDGKHTGKILRLEDRQFKSDKGTFDYLDIVLSLDEYPDMEIKEGSPGKVSVDETGKPLSKLAHNLINLGVKLMDDDGQPVAFNTDMLNTMLKDKPVVFMTLTKETEKGNFANVVDQSVKSA